jgi:hypothetical protein
MSEKLELKVSLLENGSNWPTYKHAIKIVLKTRKLFHVLEPENGCKNAGTDDEKLMVMGLLINSMHESQFSFTGLSEDPATAWSNLKASKEAKGGHRAIQLLHSLSTSSQASDSVTVYSQSIMEKTRDLRSLCSELSVDQVISMIATSSFLKGLSPSLDSYAANAVGVDVKNIKIEDLISGAITEEQRQANREVTREDSVIANAANTADNNICKTCTHHLHRADRCYIKYPHLRRKKPPVFNKIKQQAQLAFANMVTTSEIDDESKYQSVVVQSHHHMNVKANVANEGAKDADRWLFDTGATRHMCNDKALFTSIIKSKKVTITFGGGSQLVTDMVGRIEATIITDRGSFDTSITDVLYVPGLVTNLLSAKALTEQCNARFTLSAEGCTIQRKREGAYTDIGFIRYSNNLLPVKILRRHHVNSAITPSPTTSLWHARLGHASKDAIHQTSVNVIGMPACEPTLQECDACHTGKERALPYAKQAANKSTERLQLVHSDLCGPLPENALGYRYYVVFVDDFSGYTDVVLLRNKSETLNAFISYKARVENIAQKPIKSFRSDGGGEFTSKEFSEYLQLDGITRQKSAAECQEQNGKAERTVQSINNITRSMLHHSALDTEFWPYAVQQAVHVKNRTSTRVLDGLTPYEAFHGQKPEVQHLRVFGCLAWGLIPQERRKGGKYVARARKAIHLGRAPEYKAYTLLDVETGKTFVSRNVTFVEDKFIDSSDQAKESDSTAPAVINELDLNTARAINDPAPPVEGNSVEEEAISREHEHKEEHQASANPSAPLAPALTNPSPASAPNPSQPISPPAPDSPLPNPVEVTPRSIMLTPLQNQRAQAELIVNELWSSRANGGVNFFSDRLNANVSAIIDAKALEAKIPPHVLKKAIVDRRKRDTNSSQQAEHKRPITEAYSAQIAANFDTVPQNHAEAMADPRSHDWKLAEEAEMDALKKCETYELVEPPEDRQIIGCRWVYSIKRDQDGKLIKFKARLVALGYSQQEGIDFDETYSPVLRYGTLRALIALAAAHGLHMCQMDVITAYLNGVIDREVYMKQPPGHEVNGKERFVCKLKKGLYGLRQSGRLWYERMNKELLRLGFTRLESDNCVYIRSSNESTTIIGLYVDDLMVLSDCTIAIDGVKRGLVSAFDMKDLGKPSFILGIRVVQDAADGSISICQDQYVSQVLKRFGMQDASKQTMTPMNTGLKLCTSGVHDEGEAAKTDIKEYQQLIGSLMYAMIATRPDIAYAVGKLAQYSSDPRKPHRDALDHVLRYLSRTRNYGLKYKKSEDEFETPTLIGYSDADWGGCLDTRRSTSAFLITIIHVRSRIHCCQ